MTATFERIKQEIRTLDQTEVELLLRDLQNEYAMPGVGDGSEAEVEAAWDEEIDARVKEIEEGKVQLISGEEFQRNTDALFAELGIQRRA